MPTMLDHARARDAAILWARDLVGRGEWVILDTETTGLDETARVVQIGILSPLGRPLLDALIDPGETIPASAMAIHGITNADVMMAPSIETFAEVLEKLLRWNTVIVYNADYDSRLLVQSTAHVPDLQQVVWRADYQCAMQWYASYQGVWNPRTSNYKWPKLPAGDHSAIGDCRATLKIIHEMARAETSGETARRKVVETCGAFVPLGEGREG